MKATRPFARGELVCEYYGNLITYEEAKKKESEYEKDEGIGCYMYYFEYKNEKMWYASRVMYSAIINSLLIVLMQQIQRLRDWVGLSTTARKIRT